MNKLLIVLFLFSIIGIIIIQKNISNPKSEYSYAVTTPTISVNDPYLTSLEPDVKKEIIQIIDVKAMNNSFTPNTFTIPHLKSIVLRVNAYDADYTFTLKDFNIDTVIPKGHIENIRVSGLGKGHFTFECGLTCRGTVNVFDIEDKEDENE